MQVFALGAVYWLVRDQDRRDRTGRDADQDRAFSAVATAPARTC